MDDITQKVGEMYEKLPYPSPLTRGRKLRELVNLLTIFTRETGYDLAGKTVLDAGTGTGHRLIEAAAAFKNTRFRAVDISEAVLAIGRQTAAHESVRNIDFQLFDVMEPTGILGSFDIILSMGVIHHLSDPASGFRNLVRNLAEDGIIFLYIYGKHGSRERMRRKQIVSLLLEGNTQDFGRGIGLIRDLGFDSFDYGWNLNFDDEESRNGLIVDAFLNVNETLFDADRIFDLMRSSGLHGFMIYGVTLEQRGCLFETRVSGHPPGLLMTTNVASHLRSPMLQEAYNRLCLADKYRLIDLLFQPNGYTLMAFKEGASGRFPLDGRINTNALMISDL